MTKGKGPENRIRPDQNTFDRKELETKSNAELLRVMDEMLARPVEEVDGDFVDACLDILQDRAPVAEDFDPKTAMDRLYEEHPAVFETEGVPPAKVVQEKKKRPRPLLRFAGALAAAVLCFAISANTLGYNPIQAFLKWVNDTIQIYSNPSGMMELPPDDPSEYHSLEEALEACGASDADRISWIPTDYSIVNVRVILSGDLMLVTTIYESERGELAIRILEIEDTEWNGTSESNRDGIEYEYKGTDYYITSNYDVTKAGWKDDQYSYEISGQVSEDEMKKIINSIT